MIPRGQLVIGRIAYLERMRTRRALFIPAKAWYIVPYISSKASSHRLVSFIALHSYERSARGIISGDEQRVLEDRLARDPEAGQLIVGTGGVRKLRVAVPGRGRSGGARVIYFYRGAKGRVYLILAYAKNKRASLTAAEKSELKKLAAILETEP